MPRPSRLLATVARRVSDVSMSACRTSRDQESPRSRLRTSSTPTGGPLPSPPARGAGLVAGYARDATGQLGVATPQEGDLGVGPGQRGGAGVLLRGFLLPTEPFEQRSARGVQEVVVVQRLGDSVQQ